MPAFNRCTLVGNLTSDPQLSYTPSQTAVADTALAVNEKWTAADGTKREDTMFINIKAFGKLAEVLTKYTKKGQCILVDGRLKLDRWEKDGVKHQRHSVVADTVQFLTSNGSRVEAGGREAPTGSDIPF